MTTPVMNVVRNRRPKDSRVTPVSLNNRGKTRLLLHNFPKFSNPGFLLYKPRA